jgi:hypothetical protein
MSKSSFRMFADIVLDLIPAIFLVPYLFTGRTNKEQTTQSFDLEYFIVTYVPLFCRPMLPFR